MLRLFLCGTLLFLALASLGQVKQEERYENTIKNSSQTFHIISLKNEGLLLIRDKEKYESGNKLWEIIILDQNMQEKKSFLLPTENRNKLVGYDYTAGKAYLLFRKGEHEKSDLDIFTIDLNSFAWKSFLVTPELTLNLTHFNAVNNHIILGGYVNKEPAIILYNLEQENIKVLPGLFQKDTELVDLRVNNNNSFNVVFIDRAVRENKKIIFQTFNESGELLLEDKVQLDPHINLQTGITSILEREDLMLLGTWGEGNSKLSNGFYALSVDPFNEQKINYVTFGELDNALGYMKPSRADRIKEKTKEELEQNGIPNFSTYTMPYRIAEYKDGFILFAEIYNPSSTYTNYGYPYSPYYYGSMYTPGSYYYPGYGRMYSRPYSYNQSNNNSQDDVKTYESLIISFDASGKVNWDASIDLDEVKRDALDQVGEFHFAGGEAILFYKDEAELKIKSINLESGEIVEVTEKIKLMEEMDEFKSEREYEGGVKHWFDNTYYVWGVQTIKNISKDDRIRDVFYINKVVIK